jgi:hypothetical protein
VIVSLILCLSTFSRTDVLFRPLQVLNWFDSLITIGLLEGFNSLIQAAKARARGYRTNRNLITMAYLIAGQLKFNLPT